MAEPSRILNVLIATPFGPGGRGGMDRLTDLIVDTLRERRDLRVQAKVLTTYGPESKLWMPFVFCGSIVRLLAARLRNEVDVVHINVAAGGSAYRKSVLALLLRRLGVPYVVHIHGSRFHESWPAGGPLLRGLVNRMFIWSAAIIALGDSWARHIGDNLPEVRSKISIQPNATKSVAARRSTPPKAGPVAISFLGALGPRKGTSHLIEALGRLSHLSNWEATIAGNGDIEAYRKLAENLGVGDRLRFPGWLGPDDVDDLLNRSDIFVLPSTAENLPMAILEAFAHGVAVISTPVGAIPEVISHGRNGLLVPVGDVEALAEALRQLIENAPLRRALAEAAHSEHAERYDIMPYIVKLTGIWRRAADMKGS